MRIIRNRSFVSSHESVAKKGYLIQIRKRIEDYLNKLRKYHDQGFLQKDILEKEFPDHPSQKQIL